MTKNSKTWVAVLLVAASITAGMGAYLLFGRLHRTVEQIKPEMRGVSLKWGELKSDTTEVVVTLTVYNPNPVSIPVKELTGYIKFDGISVATVEARDLSILKKAESPVTVSVKIDNSIMPDAFVEHIRRQERSEASIELAATFDLRVGDETLPFTARKSVETDMLSNLQTIGPIPLEKKIDIPLLGEKSVFKMSLDSISGKWGQPTSQATSVSLSIAVTNSNAYPLLVPKVQCIVESNGIVLGSGETNLLNALLPNSETSVKVDATLNTDMIDDWATEHIRRGEQSTLSIRVFMDFGVPQEVLSLFGKDSMTITLWEGDHHIKTDFLGTLQGS